jgi:hypothetical protein
MNVLVGGEEREIPRERGGHEDPVERVAMGRRDRHGSREFAPGHRQDRHSTFLEDARKVWHRHREASSMALAAEA